MSFNSMTKSVHMNRDFKNDLPPENLKAIGGAYWRNTRNKRGYINLNKALIRDDFESDLCPGNDEEYRSAVYSLVPKLVDLAQELWTEEYFTSKHFDFKDGLYKIWKLPRSRVSVAGWYENTKQYIVRKEKRKALLKDDLSKEPETIKVFKAQDEMYQVGLDRLYELEPEQQEAFIVGGIIGNTNLGYDSYSKSAKRTFKKVLYNYIDDHLSMRYSKTEPLTADVVFKIFDACSSQNHNPPFTLFYRSHTWPKMRSVFGSGIIGKLAAAMFAACKTLADDSFWAVLQQNPDETIDARYNNRANLNLAHEAGQVKPRLPRIGDWPWVAWLDWDTQFSIMRDTISRYGDNVTVVGTDFTGYDQSMMAKDFSFKLDHKSPMHSIYEFSYEQKLNAEVWTGPWRIEGIEFKSGIYDTSEDGSLNHIDLNFKSAKDLGMQIKDEIVLSDDDLTSYLKFGNLQDYVDNFGNYGFEASIEKTSMLARDGYVEFLKNHIGYIYSLEDLSVLANMKSRIYGLLHSEQEADNRGVFKVTEDIATDQVTSKYASIGKSGVPFIDLLCRGTQGTDLGQKANRAIKMIQAKEVRPFLYRDDVSASFHPDAVFEKVSVPSVVF